VTNILLLGNANKNVVISKSLLISAIAIGIMYALRVFFNTDLYISDVGGIGAFASVVGTLYGILVVFILFEVWTEFNKTSQLIDKEAIGLERLFRLASYFRDNVSTKMEKAIVDYAKLVIKSKFRDLAVGQRNSEISKSFRKIAKVIHDIKFTGTHDSIIFEQIVTHYGDLHEIRTERMSQSLIRLPALLKVFLYVSSLMILFVFIITPFSNMYYGFVITGVMAFIIILVIQVVEDLDNPFQGYWTLTPEPFSRTLRNIEEAYNFHL